ncbi:Uncharacterized protein GBIM_17757, partial [Gryllus bimaculatus]
KFVTFLACPAVAPPLTARALWAQGFHRDMREKRAAEAAAAASVDEELDEVESEVERAAASAAAVAAASAPSVDEEDDEEVEVEQVRLGGPPPISFRLLGRPPRLELAELLKQCSAERAPGRGRRGRRWRTRSSAAVAGAGRPAGRGGRDGRRGAARARAGAGGATWPSEARSAHPARAAALGAQRGAAPIPEDAEPPTRRRRPRGGDADDRFRRAPRHPRHHVTQAHDAAVGPALPLPGPGAERSRGGGGGGGGGGCRGAHTPASASSRASSATDTDQGREYVLDEQEEGDDYIAEEPEFAEVTAADMSASAVSSDMTASADLTTSAEASAEERTVYEAAAGPAPALAETPPRDSPPGSASPGSDSFELLEKPDLTDDYVVVEEVGREADEGDAEGQSVRHNGRRRRPARRARAAPQRGAPRRATTGRGGRRRRRHLPAAAVTRLTRVQYYPAGPTARPRDTLGPSTRRWPRRRLRPPAPGPACAGTGVRTHPPEPDPEVEAGKKWIEMQFQAEHAAALAYGYDMEFERGPLEDIKEEEANDFDQSSGRVGSMGSYQTSIGSFGSVKESFSSTPEYDVLAGRRFFTRSGEHDDVSMSSLQEFEQLERQLALENARKRSHGSQDSLNGTGSMSGGRSAGSGSGSSGSFGNRHGGGGGGGGGPPLVGSAGAHLYSRSGQGDDVSLSSLKEFEGLETACIEAARIETRALQEEQALLSEIEEGHESQVSESESCDTMSAAAAAAPAGESADSDDYERRMFEIDEIIRQAQSNVERFAEAHERLEAAAPTPAVVAAPVVPVRVLADFSAPAPHTWRDAGDDATRTSSDSLEDAPPSASAADADAALRASTDSLSTQDGGRPLGRRHDTSARPSSSSWGSPRPGPLTRFHRAAARRHGHHGRRLWIRVDWPAAPQPSHHGLHRGGRRASGGRCEPRAGDRFQLQRARRRLSSSGAELLAELAAPARRPAGRPSRRPRRPCWAHRLLGAVPPRATHATYQ